MDPFAPSANFYGDQTVTCLFLEPLLRQAARLLQG